MSEDSQMALVNDPQQIRLAMIGMVEGNGHPYSWSAIFNGYNKEAMTECPFPVIPEYLGLQPPEAFGIDGARVTHIWCENRADAEHVARCSKVPQIVDNPKDVIGQVDAVIIPTDKGWEHVDRARPFVETGLPLMIDKPLADNLKDLRTFIEWDRKGIPFVSCSPLRYSPECQALRAQMASVGELRLLTMTTVNSWERYGIHALETIYPFLPTGGWQSVVHSGDEKAGIVHIRHECRAEVVLAAISDMFGGSLFLNVHGTKGHLSAQHNDTFHAFKTQLTNFINYLQTGIRPIPFEETVELMKIIIAGVQSREQGGKRVYLKDIDME